MGGHGGLNILPQKKWNVYNYDNREKVMKDREAIKVELNKRRQKERSHNLKIAAEELKYGHRISNESSQSFIPQTMKPVEEEEIRDSDTDEENKLFCKMMKKRRQAERDQTKKIENIVNTQNPNEHVDLFIHQKVDEKIKGEIIETKNKPLIAKDQLKIGDLLKASTKAPWYARPLAGDFEVNESKAKLIKLIGPQIPKKSFGIGLAKPNDPELEFYKKVNFADSKSTKLEGNHYASDIYQPTTKIDQDNDEALPNKQQINDNKMVKESSHSHHHHHHHSNKSHHKHKHNEKHHKSGE